MSTTNTIWKRMLANGSEKHFVIGASVYRLVAGFSIVVQYLLNYGQRRYLHGPEGIWPWELFAEEMSNTANVSIYSWSSSITYFEICYHLGLVVALLWFLGWRTRWLTPINFIFIWSLHQRFDYVWDAGDTLLHITLIYAMFADVSSHYSLDALRGRCSQPRNATLARVEAMFHNAAIFAFAIQLSLVYGSAGLAKVEGEVWRNGTALYYALRDGELVWPGFSEMVYQNAFLIALLTYTTVLFQVAFPFLLFMSSRTRLVAVSVSMMFHIGIALFLGLVTFSLFMMAADLTLVTDDEYRRAKRRLMRIPRAIGRGKRTVLPAPQEAVSSQ